MKPARGRFSMVERCWRSFLDVFGEDGVRSYLLGYVEGIVDIMEDE